YPDSLPVLYFRRTPGVDTPVAQNQPGAGSVAAYYLDENGEYLSGLLTSSNESVIDQSEAVTSGGKLFDSADLAKTVQTDSATPSARGNYLLLSAGSDRFYGTPGGGRNDNIAQVGGN